MDGEVWLVPVGFDMKRACPRRGSARDAVVEDAWLNRVPLHQLAVIQTFDTQERLKELGGEGKRVLVLVGEEDILIPVALSRDLWKGIEGAEWKAVKGGHAFAWEEADEFNEAVVEFLTRQTGA